MKLFNMQKADYRILAELMDNNNVYDKVDQLKGMLEDLRRIEDYVTALLCDLKESSK